jgi:hypothetical protein
MVFAVVVRACTEVSIHSEKFIAQIYTLRVLTIKDI